jgi:hypothetical protein
MKLAIIIGVIYLSIALFAFFCFKAVGKDAESDGAIDPVRHPNLSAALYAAFWFVVIPFIVKDFLPEKRPRIIELDYGEHKLDGF